MGYAMNRRQIVSLLGAAAIVGPAAALAQISAGRRRRVGLMVATGENDAEGKLRAEAFSRALGEAGWVDGRNVDIDVVWYRGSFPVAQTVAKDSRRSRRRGARGERHPGHGCRAGIGYELAYRFCRRQQSGWRRVCPEPVAARRQHHRLQHVRAGDRGQVAPAAEGGGARHAEREHAARSEVCWFQLVAEGNPGHRSNAWALSPHAAFASTLEEIERAVETISTAGFAWPGRKPQPDQHRQSPTTDLDRQREADTCNLSLPLLCAGGCAHGIWLQCSRSIQALRRLCRSHPAGRKGGRSAGAGTQPVRAWASISGPQRRWASPCPSRSSSRPTRLSSSGLTAHRLRRRRGRIKFDTIVLKYWVQWARPPRRFWAAKRGKSQSNRPTSPLDHPSSPQYIRLIFAPIKMWLMTAKRVRRSWSSLQLAKNANRWR